jgi:hypothetical protein
MIEFFDSSAKPEAETFTDFEKSMEDTVFLAAAREAKRREEALNGVGHDEESLRQEGGMVIHELDQMVSHVYGTEVVVSGMVQGASDGDESEYTFVQEVKGKFDGFYTSYRDGNKINFDAMIIAVVNQETGQFITTDTTMDEDESYEAKTIQVRPLEVFMKFERMHPIRARAILQTTHPDTLEELDARIIHDGEDADDKALLGLRGLNIKEDASGGVQSTAELLDAVRFYLEGMLSVDNDMPYILSVDGNYLPINTGKPEDVSYEKSEGVKFRLGQIIFHQMQGFGASKGDHCLALVGTVLSDTPDEPGTDILLPLESITQLRSLRRLVSEVYADLGEKK